MNSNPSITAQDFTAPSPWYRPARSERRLSPRQRTVYRVAHVETREDSGLARIYNISDEGLGLQVHFPVMLGDTITVRLTEDIAIEGQVVWTSGADCGLQLSDPVDSEALLRAMAAQAGSTARRPLRLPVNKPAIARSERGIRKIEIQDVSQNGMKVVHDGSFTEGLRVKVSLASGLERRGVVRWSRGGIAGLILLEPFSASELGSTKHF